MGVTSITYSLVDQSGSPVAAGYPFKIDPSSGIVTVAGEVDRETLAAQVTVRVKATSSDTSSSIQDFTVNIVDQSDAAPAITVNDPDLKLNDDGTVETATVTFTFNQPTTTFSLSQIDAPNGTFGPLSGSGEVFTAVFTPNQAITEQQTCSNISLR